MRRTIGVLLVVGSILAGLATGEARATDGTEGPRAHPRLLFSAQDVPALRARVAVEGSVPHAAWVRLREKAEGHLVKVRPEVVRANVGVPSNLNGLEKPYTLQNEMATYLIELGLAYQLSGDARYGRHAVELELALGDAGFPFWSGQDLGIGDLLEGFGLAFDWTYELMTPSERREIVGDLWAYERLLFGRTLFEPANPFAANNPVSNWMGVTSGGAGLTLLAIRDEPGAPTQTYRPYGDYLAKALERTRSFFVNGVDPRGANHEGMTYAVYGLKNSIPFAVAARREGLGDLVEGTGLRGMARWAAFEQLPGEGQNFVPLNDSQRTQFGVDLEAQMFAIDPGNGVAQWLWRRTVGPDGSDFYAEPHVSYAVREDKCRRPYEVLSTAACDLFQMHGNAWTILFYRTPEETPEVDPGTAGPLSVHYEQRGLVDARTGFSHGDRQVVSTFEALRDGSGHFQHDRGNVTVYGYGGRWAVDPGYSCVACGSNADEGFAKAHNVVIVDDNRATQSNDARWWKGTTIDSFVNAPHMSLAHADLGYAYGFASQYAGRDHLFTRVPGRPVIVAMADQLQRDKDPSPADHRYTWQMLTNDGNVVRLDGSAFSITAPNGAVLSGRTAAGGSAAADPTTALRFQFLTNPTDDYGSALPVVTTTTAPQPRFDHLAVLALTPSGSPAATTETLRVQGGNAIAVRWHGARDVVARRLAGSAAVTGPVETDAEMATFTVGRGESLIRGGTVLSSEHRTYVAVTGSPATVYVSGHAVSAEGAATNAYRVYAPQEIATVTVNGLPAPSCREGAFLRFPCVGPTVTG